MKKYRLLIPLVAMGMVLTSCSQGTDGLMTIFDNYASGEADIDTDWVDYGLPLKSINFASGENNREVAVGEEHEISYTVNPTDALINWKSSDEEIATVSKGVVKGISPGKVSITASGGEGSTVSKSININVIIPIEDFNVTSSKSLVMDLGESSSIEYELSPYNTTEDTLVFKSNDEEIVSVDAYGVIKALKVGNTTVSVTHPKLNREELVSVKVEDQANYLSSIVLASELSEVELNSSTNLLATLIPVDTSKEPTYTNVEYEVNDISGENVISVTDSGYVSARAVGKASVVAKVYENRKEVYVTSNAVEIEVFEVIPNAIHIDSEAASLSLNNIDKSSVELGYHFDVEAPYTEPTRSNVTWESSDKDVVTVIDGVVSVIGKGNAIITVKDTIHNLEDSIEASVEMRSTGIALKASLDEREVGGSITFTAETEPGLDKLNDGEVLFSVEPSENAVLSVDGAKATLTTEVAGNYTVTASNGGHSASKTVRFFEDFKDGNVYLVGNTDLSSGTSIGRDDSYWTLYDKSLKFTEMTPAEDWPENMTRQFECTVDLKVDDQLKLRKDKETWIKNAEWIQMTPGDDSSWKFFNYLENYGSVALDDVNVITEDGNKDWGNLLVKKDGLYNFYYKEYDDGSYQITIKETPTLNVDKTSVMLHVGDTGEFKISDWTNPLTVKSMNEQVATIVVDENGNSVVTAVAIGETVISIKDARKELSVGVSVVSDDIHIISDRTIYLNANDIFDKDGAIPFIHAIGTDVDILDTRMKLVKENEMVYKVTLSELYEYALFARLPAGSATLDWNTYYNKTEVVPIPEDDNAMFTITGYSSDDHKDDHDKKYAVGEWTVYDPEHPYVPEPADEPENNGYYLLGSKTNYKYAGAPMLTEFEGTDEHGNKASLLSYHAEKDEAIKVKYFNKFTNENVWACTEAVEGLGTLDKDGNFVLSRDAIINVFAKWDNSTLKFYVAEYEEPDVPAKTGYYLVGSKTNYKYEGATEIPEQELDADKNIAVLRGYSATKGESFKVRYHNLEKDEDLWGTAHAVDGLGKLDDRANFEMLKDAVVDIFVKYVDGKLNFYVSDTEGPDVPAKTGYYLVGSKTEFKYKGATEIPEQDVDADGNIAILRGYEATKGESFKVRYHNLEKDEDIWGTAHAVEGLGKIDEKTNFEMLKDATVDIFVKYVDSKLNFYVAEHKEAPTKVTYTLTNLPQYLLNNGCVVFAYVWGGTEEGWCPVTVNPITRTGTFEAYNDTTGMKVARCVSGTTVPNWDASGDSQGRIYNITGEIKVTSGNYTYEASIWYDYVK